MGFDWKKDCFFLLTLLSWYVIICLNLWKKKRKVLASDNTFPYVLGVYMGRKQELIDEIKPLLKEKGYKKVRQTWYKDDGTLIVVFNIQSSYYDKDDYYINLGVIIKALAEDGASASLTNCHLQQRIEAENDKGEFLTAEKFVRVLELWEQWYGNLKSLHIRALEGKFPMFCTAKAKSYLTTVRFG